jgi:tetratricopeptide (TPR) repeat protein
MPKRWDSPRELAFLLANCADPTLRDPAQATEFANKALDLAPRHALNWLVLGSARYRRGDWQGAIAALTKADAGSPGGNPYVWIFLAMAHAKKGERKQAQAWYDRTVRCMDERRTWVESLPIVAEELPRLRTEAAAMLNIEK